MHPKKLKGINLDFKAFDHLSFVFGFGFEYFENLLQISNKIIWNTKKNFFLSIDLRKLRINRIRVIRILSKKKLFLKNE